MKLTIKKLSSLALVFSMLLALIPFRGAAVDDEDAGLETLEDVTFSFELAPGDLPLEQLRVAELKDEDIPSCIDPELARSRGHVNRLYLQEPDACTIMFQNRDGSKTIYLFSQPVKGTGLSLTARLAVRGAGITFSGDNAITSRLAELTELNIGHAELAYLPNGILSEAGIELTEDARGWAQSALTAGSVYAISSIAAEAFAESITASGISLTEPAASSALRPASPLPSAGLTVMSISYSELAGEMSFKSVTTDRYLGLNRPAATALTTYSGIIVPYARWVVAYDSDFGYTVSNLYHPLSKCLGFDDMDEFIIDSLSYMMVTFTLTIESSANGIVLINCGSIAISAGGTLYTKSDDDDYFPSSCQWAITTKTAYAPMQTIVPAQSTQTVKANDLFAVDCTTTPATPSYSDIGLYYASNNQQVTYDPDETFDDTPAYYISTPGIYSVYYKDSFSGVRSADFVIIVVANTYTYKPKDTYSITSAATTNSATPLYLTRNSNGSLILKQKELTSKSVVRRGNVSGQIMYQDIESISRTFTFDYVAGSASADTRVRMTATMSTSQYTGMPKGADVDDGEPVPNYTLTDAAVQLNTLSYSAGNLSLVGKAGGTPVYLCDMGNYFIIICDVYVSNNHEVVVKALKSNGSGAAVTVESMTDSVNFRWNVFFVGVDAPVIKQTKSKWCGPTSLLQTLYGAGLQDNVPGNTLYEQQSYIRSILYMTPNEQEKGDNNVATYMGYFASDINQSNLLPSGYTCVEEPNTSTKSQQALRDLITNSLQNGMSCIFFTVTGGDPYKYQYLSTSGAPSGHLECIIGYDSLTDTVIINNCHYMESRVGLGEIRLSDLCADMERMWYFNYSNN